MIDAATQVSPPSVWARMQPYLLAFLTSVCLMAMEMVAGRLVSRSVGSSIYTWTTVIGVIFAGMSAGNYLGGWLAAAWRPQSVLGQLLLASSFVSLAVIWFNPVLSKALSSEDWIPTRYGVEGRPAIAAQVPEAFEHAVWTAAVQETDDPVEGLSPEAEARAERRIQLVRSLAGQTYENLAELRADLGRRCRELGHADTEDPDEADQLLTRVLLPLATEPVGPTFRLLREQGLPEEALQALLRAYPNPDASADPLTGIRSTALPLLEAGTVYRGPDGSESHFTETRFRRHAESALQALPELSAHYRREFDDHIRVVAEELARVQVQPDGRVRLATGAVATMESQSRAEPGTVEAALRLAERRRASERYGVLPEPMLLVRRALSAREATRQGRWPLQLTCAGNPDKIQSELFALFDLQRERREYAGQAVRRAATVVTEAARQHAPAPFPLRLTMVVMLVFFAPALTLGMIGPVVAQMAVDTVRRGGRAIGSVYAWAAWGSIVGTFLTGFVLIGSLGCYAVLALCALTLALLGVLCARPRMPMVAWTGMVAMAAGLVFHQQRQPNAAVIDPRPGIAADQEATGWSALWRQFPEALAQTVHLQDPQLSRDAIDSDYQFVKVTQDDRGDGTVLSMSLDHLVHGYVHLRGRDFTAEPGHELDNAEMDTTKYGYDALRAYSAIIGRSLLGRGIVQLEPPPGTPSEAAVEDWAPPELPPLRGLCLGGGSYTFERCVIDCFPGKTIRTLPGQTLRQVAAEHYGHPAGHPDIVELAVRLYVQNRRIRPELSPVGPKPTPSEPGETQPGETQPGQVKRVYGLFDQSPLPAGLRLVLHDPTQQNLPPAPKPKPRIDPRDPKPVRPATEWPAVVVVTQAGDTLAGISELAAPVRPDRTGTREEPPEELRERMHRQHAALLGPAFIDVPLPAGLDLEVPSVIDVAELDPMVTEVAHTRLKLARFGDDARIRTWNCDARNFVEASVVAGRVGQYDFVSADCVNHYNVPYHLTTVEFNRQVKSLLRPGGVFVSVVIDDYVTCRFMSAFLHTLRTVYKNTLVLVTRDPSQRRRRETFTVACSDGPLPLELLGGLDSEVTTHVRAGDLSGLAGRFGESDPSNLAALRRLVAEHGPTAAAERLERLRWLDNRTLSGRPKLDRFLRPGLYRDLDFDRVALTPEEIDRDIIEPGRSPSLWAGFRDSSLARPAIGRLAVRYAVTDDSLVAMTDRGVPATVTRAMLPLSGERFANVDDFRRRLQEVLSRRELALHQPRILEAARDRDIDRRPALLFTDDIAPVDDLLAPLLERQ